MIADTGTTLLILGIFVLPGFITLLLRERLYIVKGEDTSFERLLQALFYSATIYGAVILVGLTFGLDKADVADFHDGAWSLGAYLFAGALVFLALPFAYAVVGSIWKSSRRIRPRLLKRAGASEGHNVLSGWNELFSKQGGALIRVTLTDGRVLGGLYAEGSLAGYTQDTQDLYLYERWELDDDSWFVCPAPGTLGFWVPRESIVSLEVYTASPAPPTNGATLPREERPSQESA